MPPPGGLLAPVGEFLDAWFSASTQARIQAVRASLKSGAGRV